MSEEIVNVPVPAKYLGDVYALLGKLANPPPPPPVTMAYWTRERIVAAYTQASDQMKWTLQYLAQNGDKPVGRADLCTYMGIPGTAVGGMLGAFGTRCSNRFNNERPYVEGWDDSKQEKTLTMPAFIAEVVKALPSPTQ